MSEKLTLSEIAAHYRVTERTFKKYIKVYKLPYVLIGRYLRFDLKQVDAVLQNISLENAAEMAVELSNFKTKRKSRPDAKSARADYWRKELGLS